MAATTFTLRPTAVQAAPWARGTFVATGAASVTAAVNDQSDSSYISVSPAYTANPAQGASINFSVQQLALPAGARLKYIKPYIRANRTVPAARSVITRLHDGRTPNILTSVVTSTTYLDTAIADYYPGGESVVPPSPSSTLINQDYLNSIFVEAWGPLLIDGAIRIYEMGVYGVYDLAPTATVLSPSGTLSTTNSPTVTWQYADDAEQQSAYQVRIYDSAGTTLVYDSGSVSSTLSYHALPIVLPNASYKLQVRVAQNWDHNDLSPGVFWSPWTPFTSFTLTTIQPAQPSIVVTTNTQNDGKLSIATVTDQNLLDYSGQSFELGAAGWTATNATFTTSNAQFRSGGLSGVMVTTGSNATLVSPLFPALTTAKLGLSYFAQKPSSGGATSVSAFIDWYDASASLLSSSTAVTVAPVNGSWTQGVNAALAPPANAAWGQVRFLVATTAWTLWLDDVFVWASDSAAGTSPAFTAPSYAVNTMRGGLVNQTPNLLSYQDSSNENILAAACNWAPTASTTTLTLSSTQALHGTQSMRVTRNTSTGTASLDLATVGGLATTGTSAKYFQIPSGTKYLGARAWIYSGAARFADVIIKTYNSNLTLVNTYSSGNTTTLNAWAGIVNQSTGLTPAEVYCTLTVDVQAVVVGEFHYIDNLSLIMPTSLGELAARALLGPIPAGYTNFSSNLLVEYQDAGTSTWTTLTTFAASASNAVYTYDDYEVAGGVQRTYRATLGAVVDNQAFYSPSASASGTEVLNNVWIHALSNPAGTVHNFMYDGDGAGGATRQDAYDTNPVEFQAAGRPYPLVEFGEHRTRKLTVKLQLPSTSDVTAFNTLANTQGLLVYRDGRGRRGRGYIDAVQFTDTAAGQSVSFQFIYAGNQP